MLKSVVMIAMTAVPMSVTMSQDSSDLDARVRAFLDSRRGTWRDMNVPEADGKVLYELIVKNGYTRALEIGTSTGHSTIWIAWALSKTGGKVTTIEIDRGRYELALRNFEEAGLSRFIDARLADAHELVPTLEGPFDFVFSDADKDWYRKYFEILSPRIVVNGCFAAHNVLMRMAGIREFLDYVQGLPTYRTTIERSSSAGMSISIKLREDTPPKR